MENNSQTASTGSFLPHSYTEWALIAVVYAGVCVIDRSMGFFTDHLSAIPLATGVAFAALYRLGIIASVMVFGISFLVTTLTTTTGNAAGMALFWAGIDAMNALLGIMLYRLIAANKSPFDTTKGVLLFFVSAAILPLLVTSAIGDILIDTVDLQAVLYAPDSSLTWFLGGAIGCILSASLVVRPAVVNPGFSWEAPALLLLGAAFSTSFAGLFDLDIGAFPLQYLIYPLLLWSVFRVGLSVASAILVISTVATLWGTTEGFGPFVRETVAETTLFLQAFFGLTGVTVLILHAALSERRHAEAGVRAARDELEKRVEERTTDLQEAMQEAEEANRTKSRFLAAASHDLRQPIHAISLFATALQTRLKEKDNAQLVSRVQSSLTNLGGMLDGLLDMSRLENDAIVPQIHDFPVQNILDDIQSSYGTAAEAKGLRLRIMPSSLTIRSDQALLARIIGNFVTNAIRYTEIGSILVGCRNSGDGIRIEVHDSGRGMSPEEAKQVFDPYTRLEGAKENSADGLGLGLAIADGLAGLMDHPIAISSLPGKGSTFSITVPRGTGIDITSDRQVPLSASYSVAFRGVTVLAIDDDADVLEGMKTVLSDWGCEVRTAGDANSALQVVAELGERLDIIITDFHLPENRTGIDLLSEITDKIGCHVPAIVISGDTQPERRREVEAAGYFLLNKPIQPVALRPLLRRLMPKH